MKHEWKGGTTPSTPDNPPEGYSYCEQCGVEENDDNEDGECTPEGEGTNMVDTQQNGMTKEEVEKFMAEMENHWGKILRTSSVDFKDGRKVILVEHERVYLVRVFNPSNQGELQGIQLNLSRETLYALSFIYAMTDPELAETETYRTKDRDLFNEKITDELAEKLGKALTES